MCTGSENGVDLFPVNFQCDQSLPKTALLMWLHQAPSVPSEGENQSFQYPQPAGAVWTLNGYSPSRTQSQKENRYHSLRVSPGKHKCHLSPEQDVLGTMLRLASPGLMNIQASGQNTQAFPCPCVGSGPARATPCIPQRVPSS